MQPLMPVAAPVVTSEVNSAPAAPTASGSSSDDTDEWHIEYNELETHKYTIPPWLQ